MNVFLSLTIMTNLYIFQCVRNYVYVTEHAYYVDTSESAKTDLFYRYTSGFYNSAAEMLSAG
jgi:hypothetical protein